MAPFIAIICMFLAFPNHLKVMGQVGAETVQGSGDCPACDTAGFDALLAKEKEVRGLDDCDVRETCALGEMWLVRLDVVAPPWSLLAAS